jgi:riboflavin kinase/FMN adenylyltransferase
MSKGSTYSASSPVPSGKIKVTRKSVMNHCIRGTVVHGNHLGRTLGFPTANIQSGKDQPYTIPNGVYLVNVRLKERKFFGLCNIGKRPTIGGTDLVTEVHILEFCEDIYGKEISIKVIRSIRKEKKFQNLDMLVNQINLDKEKAMRMLSALNKDQTG